MPALVVGEIRVIGIAVHQRACCKEQHSGTDGEAHYGSGPAVLAILAVSSRKELSHLKELPIQVVYDFVVRRARSLEGSYVGIYRSYEVRAVRHRSVGVCQEIPVVGRKKAALGLHIFHLLVRKVLVRKGFYVLDEDVCLAYALRQVSPIVAAPIGRRSPFSQYERDYVPVPLSPPLGRGHIVTQYVLAKIAAEAHIRVRDSGIDIAEPSLHACLVVEDHLEGEFRVALLVQPVA